MVLFNDTEFIHVDFAEGKRVLAYGGGGRASTIPSSAANFSDFETAGRSIPRRIPRAELTSDPSRQALARHHQIVPTAWAGRDDLPWSWVYALS
jgi:hypothetical protein